MVAPTSDARICIKTNSSSSSSGSSSSST
jgi:hypothetical protein